MKKYLLLASVAGCLLANNAMADVAAGGQSATLTATAELVPADTIASVQNMDFGKIAVKGIDGNYKHMETDVLIATMTPAGIVTSQHEDFITSSATTPKQGKVIFTNSLHDISISCDGDEDPTNGGMCDMGGGACGLVLKNVTMSTEGKTINLGGSLYTHSGVDGDIDMTQPVQTATLTVTLKY